MTDNGGVRATLVAEVLVEEDGRQPGRRGSGYLVSSGLVLTAAHVVRDARAIRVRLDADRPTERSVASTVIWLNERIDVALLVGPTGPAVPRAAFAAVGERDATIRCSAVGFPLFKLRQDADGSRYRDACHATGTCAPMSNRREGTLELRFAAPQADPDPTRSPWEGMSGAAVWSGARIIGVVASHHRAEGLGRLTASRVDRWHESLDDDQRRQLEALLGTGLGPGRLPQLRSGPLETTTRAEPAARRRTVWAAVGTATAAAVIAVIGVVSEHGSPSTTAAGSSSASRAGAGGAHTAADDILVQKADYCPPYYYPGTIARYVMRAGSDYAATAPVEGPLVLDITNQTSSKEAVILSGIHILVRRRSPAPTSGITVQYSGCGGAVIVRYFSVDLDAAQPKVVAEAGGGADGHAPPVRFPFSITPGDPEIFELTATGTQDCTFDIEIDWIAAGRPGKTILDNHGKHFRQLRVAKNLPNYTFPSGQNSPIPAPREEIG
ncbi:serine protease [Streptomyces sp. NPDC006655]|uniref:S1 family peptidase n=1 Tax=Streptomyces sp. NPDC006655 TaxID=3156898 RepID=UPI0034550EBE